MASADVPRNLDAIWAKAAADFRDLTKQDISRKDGVRPGELDSLLDRVKNETADSGDHGSKDSAVRILGDVLKVVQFLGGLAATAASTIFSPAGMCFNAVSFLIDGVGRMKKFHASIGSLFGSIQTILRDFKMMQRIEGKYTQIKGEKGLPTELIMTTTKLMTCFVRICALAFKSVNRGTFKRVLVDVRVAFTDDDGGIAAELANLKGIVQERDSITGVITLEEVMKSRADIRDVYLEVSEQKKTLESTERAAVETNQIITDKHSEEIVEKRLSFIAKKLKIESPKDKEPPPVWKEQKERLTEINEGRIEGSGAWLNQAETYVDWRDWQSGSGNPVLCLRGRKDTGKTYVISRVIDDQSNGNGTEPRAAVAYYFFGERSDRSVREDPKPVSKALCCMAYMLAKSCQPYAKRLEVILLEIKDDRDPTKFPTKRLLEDLQLTRPQPVRFTLVFDGLDQVTDGDTFIEELCQVEKYAPRSAMADRGEAATTQSRLFQPKYLVAIDPTQCDVTGHGFANHMDFLDLCDRESIADRDQEPRNITDLELFIKESINDPANLLGPHAQENPRLFDRFRAKLLEISSGQYTAIQNRVRLVSQMIENPELKAANLEQTMLSDESDDLGKAAQQVLDSLQAEFKSAVDITQINTILMWCMYGCDDGLTLEQIDAITAIDRNSSTFMKFSQKLKSKRTTYHKLFKMSTEQDRTRVDVQEPMREWLAKDGSVMDRQGAEEGNNDNGTISLNVTIHRAKPEAVKRFLWDLHEKLTYDKSFFTIAGSQIQAAEKIRVDTVEAHSKILYQSLDLLIDDPVKETEILRPHVFVQLPSYIRQASNEFDSAFPNMNAIIGKLVVFLSGDTLPFLVRQAIDDGLDNDMLGNPLYTWIYWEENIAAMDKLLSHDRIVTLPPELRRPLRTLLDKHDGPGACLFHMAKEIGRVWLVDEIWPLETDWGTPFDVSSAWILQYLTVRLEWIEWKTPSTSEQEGADRIPTEQEAMSNNLEAIYTSDNSTQSKPAEPESDLKPLSRRTTTQLSISTNEPANKASEPADATIMRQEEPKSSDRKEPALASRLFQAANWVEKHLNLSKRNAVFLERLGWTFFIRELYSEAAEQLQNALAELDKSTQIESCARIHRRLAQAYKESNKFDQAIKEANEGLACCERFQSEVEQAAETRQLKKILAEIYKENKEPGQALTILTELIDADAYDWDIHRDLLEVSYVHKQTETAKEIFDRLCDNYRQNEFVDTKASYLVELVNHIVDLNEPPHTVVWQAHAADRLDKVIESFDQALKIQRKKASLEKKNAATKYAYIQLSKGYAYALNERDYNGFRKGYESWSEALAQNCDYGPGYEAACAAANYHFSQLEKSPAVHLKKIREIKEKHSYGTSSILARAYFANGQPQVARAQMRNSVKFALELLTDDDDENDWEGYYVLGHPLACCGDTANALAARSLIRPTLPGADTGTGDGAGVDAAAEKHLDQTGTGSTKEIPRDIDSPQTVTQAVDKHKLGGPLGWVCDGRCGKQWKFTDDFWECDVCQDCQFCTECLDKLKTDQLSRWICHKSHSWMYNPPWTLEEYERVPKDSVCIPRQIGELEWSREQGEIIPISDWIQRIKDDWETESTSTRKHSGELSRDELRTM